MLDHSPYAKALLLAHILALESWCTISVDLMSRRLLSDLLAFL